MMKRKLAKVRSASLDIKGLGILTFWIHVDYEEGCSQSVGGICLDMWSEDKQSRVGTAFGCEVIRRLLLEMNVNDFSEMRDRKVWVCGTGEGLHFTPKGIAALKVDNSKTSPVYFDDILEEFGTEGH